MTTQHPEALRLADELDLAPENGIEPQTSEDAAAELRRLHAENEALQDGYAAARLEIESLQARIKTMAEEHADELAVAHLDGRMRAAQPASGLDPELGPMLDFANAGEIAFYDYAVAQHCRATLDILDGKDNGAGACNEPWASVRKRLLSIVELHQSSSAAHAGEYPALVCDYCGALTPDPWHSSGMLHGKMSKHIHSCDACWRGAAQPAPVRGSPADLPPLPDPDLRDVGTNPEDIKNFLRGYATEYAKAALAAQDAQEPVAWYVTGGSRLLDEDEAKAEARHIGGTARAMPLYTSPKPSPTAQAADSVLEDAARYRWLRERMLGIDLDWNESGITAMSFEMPEGCAYGGCCNQNIDAARKQGANND